MDSRVRDRVADWSERPVQGTDGLRTLADEGFSGVVERTDGAVWAAMLNGTVLGVHGGTVAEFAGHDATARVAPADGAALLVAMFGAGGSQEDQYYTEDYPISEATETLSSGGFAGYVELSENVLSGDYYVAFYGDRALPVAFVGNSDRLITGDEALDRADDEVGIYQVYSVDLEVVSLPGTEDTASPSGADDPSTTDASGGTAAAAPSGPDDQPATDPRDGDPDAAEPRSDHGPGPSTSDREETVAAGGETGAADRTEDADPDREPEVATADDAGTRYGASTDYASRTDRRADQRRSSSAAPDADADPDTDATPAPATEPDADADAGTAPDPVLDEQRTDPAGDGPTRTDQSASPPGGDAPADGGRRVAGRDRPTESPPDDAGTGRPASPAVRERLEDHERRIADLRERAAALETADEQAEERRRDLRAEVEQMADDLSDLRRTVLRLDSAVERLVSSPGEDATSDTDPATAKESAPDGQTGATADAEGGDAASATVVSAPAPDAEDKDSREMTPAEALAETTLLLRYGSRGSPTLEAAHDDADVERSAVEQNLRVDVHTPFDDRTAMVEGRPYREFVEGRIEYRFFEWLVRDLLFEIRDTGNEAALGDLYDALPAIDRAELHSTVAVASEGEDESVAFDVVVRDAHERPLVVARINASRDPATEDMVVGLRDSASVVGEATDLAAAFSVTESYFSGTARDAAEEATADSILSRNAKESYVKLSRKRGYHLCLVAVGSDDEFHLRVPDL